MAAPKTDTWVGSCDHCGERSQLHEHDGYALCDYCDMEEGSRVSTTDGEPVYIDTLDYDGDDRYCRVRYSGEHETFVVLKAALRAYRVV